MLLFVLAYIGGVLTILSPCILPVLPFVFARADEPFLRRGLPMLLGMAATFAVIATLAAVGGGWAVEANEYGRYAALALLALFGVTLGARLSRDLGLARPAVQLERFSIKPTRHRHCERSENHFDLACLPRRRGASPPPIARRETGVLPDALWWGRDRVGGRALPNRLAPFSQCRFRVIEKRSNRAARRASISRRL